MPELSKMLGAEGLPLGITRKEKGVVRFQSQDGERIRHYLVCSLILNYLKKHSHRMHLPANLHLN